MLFCNWRYHNRFRVCCKHKALGPCYFFPYTSLLTHEFDENVFVVSPRSKLWTECWYFCNLHVTISLFISKATNTREKIARNMLSIHETISICVASPFVPRKIVNTKTSCLGCASDLLFPAFSKALKLPCVRGTTIYLHHSQVKPANFWMRFPSSER